MTELKNLATTLRAAGVTQGEFALLVGVSRVTAVKWSTGKKVHSLALARASQVLDRIAQATEAGKLPLDSTVRGVLTPKHGRFRNELLTALSMWLRAPC